MISCSSRTIDKGEGRIPTKPDNIKYEITVVIYLIYPTAAQYLHTHIFFPRAILTLTAGQEHVQSQSQHSSWQTSFHLNSSYTSLCQEFLTFILELSWCIFLFLPPVLLGASAINCLSSHNQENLKIPFHTFLNSSRILRLLNPLQLILVVSVQRSGYQIQQKYLNGAHFVLHHTYLLILLCLRSRYHPLS